jgi:DNA-binding transcriptional ArsR family regulator
MTEKYLLFSLEDEKTKKIAEILSSPICKKILDLLSEKELTEKEISLQLKIPLNTAEYNLKKLIDVKLVESVSHFWSIKGKRMPAYKISNKKILISPKSKKTIPLVLTAILAGFASIGLRSLTFSKNAIPERLPEALNSISSDLSIKATMASQSSSLIANNSIIWFICGVIIFIAVYFLTKYFIKKLKGG